MSLPMLFFILIGAVSLAAAAGVVTSRQPVHGALFLLVHFVTLAVLYVTLEAQFLAAIQVIIYAGGIVILILFVIMLIGSERLDDDPSTRSWGPYVGLVMGLVLLAALVVTLLPSFLGQEANIAAMEGGAPYQVGMTLFTEYILPIEMAAILLLVALLGALLLARHPKAEKE